MWSHVWLVLVIVLLTYAVGSWWMALVSTTGFDDWMARVPPSDVALSPLTHSLLKLAWNAAVRETTHLDAQLADDLGQIAALLARLEEHVTRYAAREEEVGSVYWHTEDPA